MIVVTVFVDGVPMFSRMTMGPKKLVFQHPTDPSQNVLMFETDDGKTVDHVPADGVVALARAMLNNVVDKTRKGGIIDAEIVKEAKVEQDIPTPQATS